MAVCVTDTELLRRPQRPTVGVLNTPTRSLWDAKSELEIRHTLIWIGVCSERKRLFVDCRYTSDPWRYVRAGIGSLVDEIKAVPWVPESLEQLSRHGDVPICKAAQIGSEGRIEGLLKDSSCLPRGVVDKERG